MYNKIHTYSSSHYGQGIKRIVVLILVEKFFHLVQINKVRPGPIVMFGVIVMTKGPVSSKVDASLDLLKLILVLLLISFELVSHFRAQSSQLVGEKIPVLTGR